MRNVLALIAAIVLTPIAIADDVNIPVNTRTYDRAHERWTKSMTALFLKAYKKADIEVRNPDPEDMENFIRVGVEEMMRLPELRDRDAVIDARNAVSGHAKDPFFQFFRAFSHEMQLSWDLSAKTWHRAITELREIECPTLLIAIAGSRNGSALDKGEGTTQQANNWYEWSSKQFIAALKAREIPNSQDWMLWQILLPYLDSIWSPGVRKSFCQALDRDELSTEWLRHMAWGTHYVEAAWDARGGATEIRNPQGFIDNLRLAKQRLDAAHALHPSRPDAATHLITVHMGIGDRKSAGDHFEDAVTACCDWPHAYFRFARSRLPRWGGSPEEMVTFAESCLETERYDTMIPLMGVYAMLLLSQDMENRIEVLGDPQLYAHTKMVFTRLEADPKMACGRIWYASILLALAHYGGDEQEQRRLRGIIGRHGVAPMHITAFDLQPEDLK